MEKVPSKKLPSGYEIPMIGFGTYQLKGQQCLNGVKWALQAGYKHIDTAVIYKNEEEIGKVLKELKINRSEIYITSKIPPQKQGYEEALTTCDEILKRLDTQYLDLLIIHWPGVSKYKPNDPKNRQIRRETWRALEHLKKQGKVRDIGVSNYLKHHLQDLLHHSETKPAINQFEIHPLLWQKQTIDFCRSNDIAIQAYSPLARSHEQLFQNKEVIKISQKYKKTVAQVCLRWALQQGLILLPKSRSKNRIQQNFNIFDFELSLQDMSVLFALTKKEIHTCWDPNRVTY